jgi:hypothetical protein
LTATAAMTSAATGAGPAAFTANVFGTEPDA